ncbi:hypothetical protein MIDIC_210003 [Alphaproteobacteria bacterium]
MWELCSVKDFLGISGLWLNKSSSHGFYTETSKIWHIRSIIIPENFSGTLMLGHICFILNPGIF